MGDSGGAKGDERRRRRKERERKRCLQGKRIREKEIREGERMGE